MQSGELPDPSIPQMAL